MYTIIASTNRKEALSLQIAEFYKEKLASKGIESQVISFIDLPEDFVFSALYDNSGKNEDFNLVRNKVSEADKLVFVIPEYNGSFPGVLKSFMDGLAFPHGVKGKKAALIGISSGAMGGSLAMSHFTDILNYLGCNVLAFKPRFTGIDKAIEDIEASVIPGLVEEQIEALVSF